MNRYKVTTVALVVLTAGVSAACAGPGSSPAILGQPSPSPTTVAPGCDLSGTRVRWSEPTKQPRLTRVTLFRIVPDDPASHTGQDVLDEPFTPSITQVVAPASWTALLAKSLSVKTGSTIQARPPSIKDGSYGFPMPQQNDASIPEKLLYQGVETVSANFSVDCDRTVSGTFTSWTSTNIGAVTCSHVTAPTEPLDDLARHYCRRTPSPHQSSNDAVPFASTQPVERRTTRAN